MFQILSTAFLFKRNYIKQHFMPGRENRIKKQVFYESIRKFSLQFKSYEDEKYVLGEEESWHEINKQIRRNKRTKLRLRLLYAASIAASITLIFTSIYLLKKPQAVDNRNLNVAITQLTVPEANSEILLITPDQELNIANNSKLQYTVDGDLVIDSLTVDNSSSKKDIDEPAYSQIIVPKGKRSHIFFADGTEMYINSGTRVVYPTVFSKDKREIFVDGEVYLNVKRDEKSPFHVKTENLEVKVLGTVFNVCSYNNEDATSVVLVSGKVEVVNNKKEKIILNPNELLTYDTDNMVKSYVDVFDHICWTQNMMILKHERLDKLLKRLSRYYGKEIYYTPEVGTRTISGKLDLRDDLESVMNIISTLTSLKYQTKDDSIHIN